MAPVWLPKQCKLGSQADRLPPSSHPLHGGDCKGSVPKMSENNSGLGIYRKLLPRDRLGRLVFLLLGS